MRRHCRSNVLPRGITWDSDDDADVLDARTAAVLALGEKCLTDRNRKRTKISDVVRRHERDRICLTVIYDDDPEMLAALAADRESR